MENDYLSASKKFWQCYANNVCNVDAELLTSAENIVRWWKEYFEELLNPINTPSTEEAEAGVSEVDSSTSNPRSVAGKLLVGKEFMVDEMCPEYLKPLDVLGLFWLTRLCSIARRSKTLPLERGGSFF